MLTSMTVKEIWAGNAHYSVDSRCRGPQSIRLAGDPTTIGWALREVLIAATLCNHATASRDGDDWRFAGDDADQALLATAVNGGIDPAAARATSPLIEELDCDSDTQASLHGNMGGADLYLRGTPESILPACEAMLDTHGRRWALDAADVEERAAAMRARRLSVVAFARGKLSQVRPLTAADCQSSLILIGLVGLLIAPLTLR
jgi:magnesium-transporting ATPase (P-type)